MSNSIVNANTISIGHMYDVDEALAGVEQEVQALGVIVNLQLHLVTRNKSIITLPQGYIRM